MVTSPISASEIEATLVKEWGATRAWIATHLGVSHTVAALIAGGAVFVVLKFIL